MCGRNITFAHDTDRDQCKPSELHCFMLMNIYAFGPCGCIHVNVVNDFSLLHQYSFFAECIFSTLSSHTHGYFLEPLIMGKNKQTRNPCKSQRIILKPTSVGRISKQDVAL